MSSPKSTATFAADYARRLPDPTLPDAERHVFFVRAQDVPDLPKDPNPRAQRIDRGIYREIGSHLLNHVGEPNTFHLKNKGITLIADKVTTKRGAKDVYTVSFGPGHGIVDGGHTYEILKANKKTIAEHFTGDGEEGSIRQFVKIEVITGLPSDLVPEIARGLNTAVQVQEMSLADLRDQFDWIKKAIEGRPYADRIAFRENEQRVYDARDIVVLLDLFNIDAFPNDKNDHPVRAFSSKAMVLKTYLADIEADDGGVYRKAEPILNDILQLHDTISLQARTLHNKLGGKAGGLAFVEGKTRGYFEFPFLSAESEYRLTRGALFPMLGAFRWMVDHDEDGNYRWVGGFDAVLAIWESLGGDLMRATQATSDELAKNPNQIGKSRNHWATLHSMVAKHQLIATRA